MRCVFFVMTLMVLAFVSFDGFCETIHMPSSKNEKITPGPEQPNKGWAHGLEPITINVPEDFLTIQEAIIASIGGDTVLVGPGTYVENLNFRGKRITVMSSDGPLATIIDGGLPLDPKWGSVVIFEHGEDENTVLSGFTITNGSGTDRLPLGTNCGGGIFCYFASPTITNNIIINNNAQLAPSNSSSKGGAPSGCAVAGASTPEKMFSAKMFSEWATLTGNNFIEKSNHGVGGGIGCYESSSKIINNIISDNFADTKGGGIACSNCHLILSNNTVANNWTPGTGGSIYASGETTITIIDSIYWGNDAPEAKEWAIRSSALFTTSYTNLDGGMDSVRIGPFGYIDWGLGMIDADPIFTSGVLSDYYLSHDLMEYSPCIDAGSDISSLLGYDTSWTCVGKVPDTANVDMGYHYGPHAPQTHRH